MDPEKEALNRDSVRVSVFEDSGGEGGRGVKSFKFNYIALIIMISIRLMCHLNACRLLHYGVGYDH